MDLSFALNFDPAAILALAAIGITYLVVDACKQAQEQKTRRAQDEDAKSARDFREHGLPHIIGD